MPSSPLPSTIQTEQNQLTQHLHTQLEFLSVTQNLKKYLWLEILSYAV